MATSLFSSGEPAYILDAIRTPTGKFCGLLKDFRAVDLAAQVLRALMRRNKLKAVDEVILGQVLQAGAGQNPARQAALQAGLPEATGAFTLNKCCGSGLKAVISAVQAIKAGDADLILAGGMESMSQAPHLLAGLRKGHKLGHARIEDAILVDGLWCPTCDWHMGSAAEHIARKHRVGRGQQDRFALESHRKAVRAQQEGFFRREIHPLTVAGRKIEADEGPRADSSLAKLGRLKPAFADNGSVTAGNAPGLSDGAAALLVCSRRYLKRHGLRPLAKITGYTTVGVHPKGVFLAPALAATDLCKKMGVPLNHFDLLEVNEAFSAASLASQKVAGWDPSRVNVHGGAVALGHPLGASGARILTTLVWALRNQDKNRGLAAICMGGGNGLAMALERD